MHIPEHAWQEERIGQILIEQEVQAFISLLNAHQEILIIGTLVSKFQLPFQNIYTINSQVSRSADIIGEYNNLPLYPNSVNAIFAPHIMECSMDPEVLLAEFHRVLTPEGLLFISGFNKHAWFPLGKKLRPSDLLHKPKQIKDWALQEGFTILQFKSLFFSSPINTILSYLGFLDGCGWPFWGGWYILAVQKKVIPLTPLRQSRLQWSKELPKGIAAPTIRNI